MDKRQLSHDILNMIERLKIMHDLAKDQNFSMIPKAEMLEDLQDTLQKLDKDFKELLV